jgi:hypothetical protein
MTDDPYAIDVPDNLSLDAGELRKVVKRLVLTALNARDRDSAFRAFRDLWPTGHIAKTLSNAALTNLVDTIEARHLFLDGLLFSDQGIGLMNIDARIADWVHQSRMLSRHSKTIRSRSDMTPIKCGSYMLRYKCLMSMQNDWEDPKLSSRFAAGTG